MKRQEITGDETTMLFTGTCDVCKVNIGIHMVIPIAWATMSQEEKDNITYLCGECAK